MKRRILLQAVPAILCAPQLALAQSGFPAKPIRYIVPVAAGGGSDMVGRTVTERWGSALKQSFIVDNQGGRRRHHCLPDHSPRRGRRLHIDAGLRSNAWHQPSNAKVAV